MIGINAQPMDLGADRAVSLQQQEADLLSIVGPRRPALQALGLLGIVPIGLGLAEPLRQARRQTFEDPTADSGVGFLGDQRSTRSSGTAWRSCLLKRPS
jgi:hypothetical protein